MTNQRKTTTFLQASSIKFPSFGNKTQFIQTTSVASDHKHGRSLRERSRVQELEEGEGEWGRNESLQPAGRFFGTTFRPKLGSRLQAGSETLAVILALGWVLINYMLTKC